ncbi:MAG: hypothetical protein IJS90_07715 [Clostridia bacterium]|nr:hypothetical protein [Clostridia bacterium]
MSYIRKRETELTGIQESAHIFPETDFGQDFVCVYGTGGDMEQRIKEYKDRGYVVHLMTGIAWGGYDDFLDGRWDGIDHHDTVQRSRDGSITGEFCHASGYMVPTIAYSKYITERLKTAVDAGVVAIHVEEPEFLNDGGYSESFKREYKLYYREDWVPPHENVDAHYKAARLKAYLYRRVIERVSQELKEYALDTYGRVLRFYVPTHSLLNYSTWKVMSPEGTMTDIPSLDGYKAQVWMGTAREANVFKGVYKERTFETAFMEYGIMQELVRGTGRDMWFDNDPIDDRPDYTWENYRMNYTETLMGELLQPKINRYQLAPWPRRVFTGEAKYPKDDPNATSIPEDHRTFLMNVFQMQGTFGTDDYENLNPVPDVGVFLSDTALFQRNFPDDILAQRSRFAPVPGKIELQAVANYIHGLEKSLLTGDRLDFYESLAFPLFYGLSLPLLKGGIPVRPVQLENIVRYPGYLDNYKLIVLSYEFMKPQSADINVALSTYVSGGGILCYVGDGVDPFHDIKAWWNTGNNHDKTPLSHLLRLMGLDDSAPDGVYDFGKGKFALIRKSPADFCVDAVQSDEYAEFIGSLIDVKPDKNYISLRRGEYILSSVMDECKTDEPLIHRGNFVDMLDIDFPVISEKVIRPTENAVLFDLDRIKDETTAIIGTSVRINELISDEKGFVLKGCGASCNARIRLRLPKMPKTVIAEIQTAFGDKKTVYPEVELIPDEESKTALLKFRNTAGDLTIKGEY